MHALTSSPRMLVRLFAVAIAALLVSVTSPAFAHTVLVDSSPEPGSKVAVGTELIALQFGEAVDGTSTLEVAVLDDNEDALEVSPAQAGADPTFVCTRVEALEPGVHTVRYEVTSADGHVVRGNYEFEVTEDGGAADPKGCNLDDLEAPSESKSLDDQDQSDFPAWAIWTLVGVAVITGGLAVVAVARSRRDQDDDENE